MCAALHILLTLSFFIWTSLYVTLSTFPPTRLLSELDLYLVLTGAYAWFFIAIIKRMKYISFLLTRKRADEIISQCFPVAPCTQMIGSSVTKNTMRTLLKHHVCTAAVLARVLCGCSPKRICIKKYLTWRTLMLVDLSNTKENKNNSLSYTASTSACIRTSTLFSLFIQKLRFCSVSFEMCQYLCSVYLRGSVQTYAADCETKTVPDLASPIGFVWFIQGKWKQVCCILQLWWKFEFHMLGERCEW